MSADEFVEWAFAILIVAVPGLAVVFAAVALIGLGVSVFVDWIRRQCRGAK